MLFSNVFILLVVFFFDSYGYLVMGLLVVGGYLYVFFVFLKRCMILCGFFWELVSGRLGKILGMSFWFVIWVIVVLFCFV